jgi:Xaa-Pro aminopeptidase
MLLVGESQSNQNLYYKTHFLAGDPFIYAELNGRRLLVVSSMEQGRAQKEAAVPEVKSFEEYGLRDLTRELGSRRQAFTQVVGRVVEDLGAESVVVEPEFSVAYADALRAEGIEVEVDEELVREERARKSEVEIEAIAEAQRSAEHAMARAVEILAESEERNGALHLAGIPLTSERLRTEMEIAMIKDGMDVSHSPIVAGGPGAADPHWIGEGPLRAGEAIVIDIFPRSQRTRYWGDLTRTVVKGEPSEVLRRMYEATLQAQEAAFSEIRAGANGRSAHEAVLRRYEELGFGPDVPGPHLTHGTGHGVGLEIHEGPNLSVLDVELQAGDVVTVEPGLYDPEIGGVRIEDLVVVTEDGFRNLTTFPKRFEL